MTTIRVVHDKNYTCISNPTLRDRGLSFKARGLHHFLLSFPDDWEINVQALVKESPLEGRDSIYNAIAELKEMGYIVKRRIRLPNGQFQWETQIYERPQAQDPDSTISGLTGYGLPGSGSTISGSTGYGAAGNILNNKKRSNDPLITQEEERKASTEFGNSVDREQIELFQEEAQPLPQKQPSNRSKTGKCTKLPPTPSEPLVPAKKGQKKNSSKPTSVDEIRSTLRDFPRFENNVWKVLLREYAKVPVASDGRRASVGSKVEAAIAYRDYIEAHGLEDEFERAIALTIKSGGFNVNGLRNACRWITYGNWRNELDLEEAREEERSQRLHVVQVPVYPTTSDEYCDPNSPEGQAALEKFRQLRAEIAARGHRHVS